jgi:hypothetical protein
MLDFYLIVSSYEAAYAKRWLRLANRLIPPNVFPFEHGGLAAKYAVLSEADFARECSVEARSISVWARFAQPSRLVWVADQTARERATEAICDAVPTLLELTRPMVAGEPRNDPLAIFRAGFALTYGAELRAERTQRASDLVGSETERYRQIGAAALAERQFSKAERKPVRADTSGFGRAGDPVRWRRMAERAWRRRQRNGKALTLLRLVKASLTFAGGIDYLAWKINRHAGTKIEVKPWQRRWPLLAGLILLPRLLRGGAIR